MFNRLKSFHCIGQFPLDSLHDLLEKVLPCDAASILMGLTKQGKFTLDEYNTMLSDVHLQGYELSDRPLKVKQRCEKLSGKALSVSLHIRIMPYLVWRLMGEPDAKEDNDLLDLLGIIHKLNEFIHADKVTMADVINLEDLVVQYFDKRKICSTKYGNFQRMTPKYHFLEHYAREIRRYGPLNGYCTARCESKHRDFVNFAESAKNFINLPKTLAEKHQRLLDSR